MSSAVILHDPRTCVSAEVWDREVRLIMRDHDRDRELAERIFGQAVAYLVVAGENPDIPMGPTPIVDEGVHSFMLDTPTISSSATRTTTAATFTTSLTCQVMARMGRLC